MRALLLLGLLALSACATPPARHAAFADTVAVYANATRQEADRAQTINLPPPVVQPAPPSRSRGRARVAAPAPVAPDCARLETLTGEARDTCVAVRHQRVLDLAWRHARAMAAYTAALRELASARDAGIPPARLETLRDDVFVSGAALRAAADVSEDAIEPFRPMDAPVGLRPAYAREMAEHGWRLRQQLQIQSEALAVLEEATPGETAERLSRLRWAVAYLRSALEVMTTRNSDALGEIMRARRVLGV